MSWALQWCLLCIHSHQICKQYVTWSHQLASAMIISPFTFHISNFIRSNVVHFVSSDDAHIHIAARTLRRSLQYHCQGAQIDLNWLDHWKYQLQLHLEQAFFLPQAVSKYLLQTHLAVAASHLHVGLITIFKHWHSSQRSRSYVWMGSVNNEPNHYLILPIATYGSLSVLPWACTVNSWGPVMSTPPRTRYAPM